MENLTSQQLSLILATFVLMLITIVVLTIVVVNQNRKLNYLRKPRYGFLGKPLALVFVFGFTLAGIGVMYNSVSTIPTDVSVTDEEDIVTLEIIPTTINEIGRLYRFNAVPSVNGVEWGSTGDTFTINWTFQNLTPILRKENSLSKTFNGGVLFTLQPGTTKITAETSYKGKVISKSIEITTE